MPEADVLILVEVDHIERGGSHSGTAGPGVLASLDPRVVLPWVVLGYPGHVTVARGRVEGIRTVSSTEECCVMSWLNDEVPSNQIKVGDKVISAAVGRLLAVSTVKPCVRHTLGARVVILLYSDV